MLVHSDCTTKDSCLECRIFCGVRYMKDLFEILFRLLHGDDIREVMKKQQTQPRVIKKHPGSRKRRAGISKSKKALVSVLPKRATLADYIVAKLTWADVEF
jgi:hypothetical protein